jgi:hypothetical protein
MNINSRLYPVQNYSIHVASPYQKDFASIESNGRKTNGLSGENDENMFLLSYHPMYRMVILNILICRLPWNIFSWVSDR